MIILGYEVDELKVLVQLSLAAISIYILLAKSAVAIPPEAPQVLKLTKQEEDDLIAEFKLKPMVSEEEADFALNQPKFPIFTGKKGVRTHYDNKPVIDFGTHDYLNFASRPEIVEVAKETIHKYGVGACGPRGFYGTFQCHLDVESSLLELYGLDSEIYGSMLFPFGFSTVSSIIPAFANRHDFLVVDDRSSAPVQCGVAISKCPYLTYSHNNMEDLEKVLKQHHEEYNASIDNRKHSIMTRTKNGDSPYLPRRFIVLDGVNPYTGEIAPLDKIIALAKKYYFRIIIDDTYGFGTIGNTGRGVMELYNATFEDVTFLTVSLEHAMGSVGGFAIGPREAIEISETTALGYCFSASTPPYLVACGGAAINLLTKESERVHKLQKNAAYMIDLLKKIPNIELCGNVSSQVIPFTIKDADRSRYYEIRDLLLDEGFLVPVAEHTGEDIIYTPCDHLRICVSADHDNEMMDSLAQVLTRLAQ